VTKRIRPTKRSLERPGLHYHFWRYWISREREKTFRNWS